MQDILSHCIGFDSWKPSMEDEHGRPEFLFLGEMCRDQEQLCIRTKSQNMELFIYP